MSGIVTGFVFEEIRNHHVEQVYCRITLSSRLSNTDTPGQLVERRFTSAVYSRPQTRTQDSAGIIPRLFADARRAARARAGDSRVHAGRSNPHQGKATVGR